MNLSSLNIILIGDNPSSLTYVNNKLKKCKEIGISGNLIKKPKNISWITAASFCLTLSTSYRMLISKNGAQIRSGENCLIWGGAGGLGSFAIQLAKLAGANVIAIVSSEEKT